MTLKHHRKKRQIYTIGHFSKFAFVQVKCVVALKKCKAIFEKCRPKPTCPELARDEFSDENDPHHIPSGPPKPVNWTQFFFPSFSNKYLTKKKLDKAQHSEKNFDR